MHLISSSFFGRLFGHSTRIEINNHGLTVIVKNDTSVIQWEELISPPLFHLGLSGQTISFSTKEQHYVLSKLTYNCEKQHRRSCEQLWIESNRHHLQSLLKKIKKLTDTRYLRQSDAQRIRRIAKKQARRWLPWGKQTSMAGPLAEQIALLSHYQHWQEQDITACREAYIKKQLVTYQQFFDSVESNPLTARQRRACIIDDDNNLLLAGAGTGKTSVMVGRAGYLLKSGQAQCEQILLLAYGRQAANEMDQRIKNKLATDKISATTFHSLGLYIIAEVEGKKPMLSVFAEDQQAKTKWVQRCLEALIDKHKAYRHQLLEYLSKYYYVEKNEFEFERLGDYYQYLTDNDVRSLKGERVKSFGALHIANWLFSHGIAYQYQTNYSIDLKMADRRQYQPDFFLPAFNLYIEYYSVDQQGNTPSYIDRDEYHESIKYKRDIHQRYATQCIELTYGQHKQGRLLNHLEKYFKDNKIVTALAAGEVLLEGLSGTGRISALAETFTQLIGLYKAACLEDALETEMIAASAYPQHSDKAFTLLAPILKAYRKKLQCNNEIDFEDMISTALAYVESGQFSAPWRYIMVDEFQDISEPRARLVKALRDNHKRCSIFAVGDDWQAIYRFSGADVTLTTNFKAYFGATTQTELDQTFRFNNRIGQVATEFVSKNPAQIKKTIRSLTQVDQPAVSLLRKETKNIKAKNGHKIDEIVNGAMAQVLTAISRQVSKRTSVYILARFWSHLPDNKSVAELNNQYAMLNIQTHSFHGAKGKEADYVVIVGLKSGKHGFPSNKATPPIIDALLAKEEAFAHAEERRLFYVALTRAKARAYLIADMTDASDFVKELVQGYNIELNEFGTTVNQTSVDKSQCLVCGSGTLKARSGRHGAFYSCSHFPLCDHKERACSECQSVMTKDQYPGFKLCLNPSCHHIVPLCQNCGAEMLLRESKNGAFWGCRNYRGNEALSCRYAIAQAKLAWPI